MSPSNRMRNWWGWGGWSVVLVFLLGCQESIGLPTEYGKISGRGRTSLNGTSGLAELLEQCGKWVKKSKRISPRIEKYDTIIWFPNRFGPPSEKAVDALDAWLEARPDRKLIYVGRDYDAEVDYFNEILANDSVEDRELIERRLAYAKMAQQVRFLESQAMLDRSCDWFTIESAPRRKAQNISGPLVERSQVDPMAVRIVSSSRFVVPEEADETQYFKVATLLRADQEDFVFEIGRWGADGRMGGGVVLVENGSFLLNYGLIHSGNRKLARALIDQSVTGSNVLFLESGPRDIRVSQNEHENYNSWAWLAEKPLCYIFPHFLFWGVLFCFVYFPIFGRPRILSDTQQSTFRSHLVAVGKLLQRTGNTQQAYQKILNYRENHQKHE